MRRRMGDGQRCTSHVRPRQEAMECKIEKLPKELLVNNLSYLSVKEAAKTCLVSHRWKYLWQYTTSCLEIHDKDKRTKVPEVMWRSCDTFSYPDKFLRLDNVRELELDLKLGAGESLLFFTFFVMASPFLSIFTARITYI